MPFRLRSERLFSFSRLGGGPPAASLGYPAGWVLCSILLYFYCHSRHNTLLYPPVETL